MKECWVRLGKFWERKGHSCEASRLQARPTLIRLRGKRWILIAFCQPKTWRHLN